jgi:hypothetical protein
LTCSTANAFFSTSITVAKLTTRARTDIPHATAIERHSDDLLFHGGQLSFVVVLQKENRVLTVGIVAAVALRPVGLLPVLLHHIGTVTLRTSHAHKSPRPSASGSVVFAPP